MDMTGVKVKYTVFREERCTGLPSDDQFKSSPEIVIICKTSFKISRGHISFPYCEQRCCCRTFIENGRKFYEARAVLVALSGKFDRNYEI